MTVSSENLPLAVVSGASTGMGAATAAELARRGHHVLAGVRNETDADRIRAARVEPVILDITRAEHIEAVRVRIADDPHRRPLAVLVNNAGMAANAPVETMPLDTWRRMFEVNLFGHIAMTQALLPALHASGGRIVSISSTGGRVALPAFGAYSGTKFAVEAVSDSLRRELAPLGVGVVVVEPGGVRTAMGGSGLRAARDLVAGFTPEQRERYGDLMRGVLVQLEEFGSARLSAEEAASVIAHAATTARPRTRYTIGRDAALFTRLARVLSDRALDRALAAEQRRLLRKAG